MCSICHFCVQLVSCDGRPNGSAQIRVADVSLMVPSWNVLLIWWKFGWQLPWHTGILNLWQRRECMRDVITAYPNTSTRFRAQKPFYNGGERNRRAVRNTQHLAFSRSLAQRNPPWGSPLPTPPPLCFLFLSFLETLFSTFPFARDFQAAYSWPGEITFCHYRMISSNTWAGKLTIVQV